MTALTFIAGPLGGDVMDWGGQGGMPLAFVVPDWPSPFDPALRALLMFGGLDGDVSPSAAPYRYSIERVRLRGGDLWFAIPHGHQVQNLSLRSHLTGGPEWLAHGRERHGAQLLRHARKARAIVLPGTGSHTETPVGNGGGDIIALTELWAAVPR